MSSRQASCAAALLFALASGANASIEAGRVQFVIGDAHALGAGGIERALKKGDAVHEGETIVTGASASMQLRMSDKAILAVRPNSRLQIDTYRFTGREDGSERAVLQLVKGTFRSITGLIGLTNKDNYRIITDTANIGIRGTDHEPAHLQSGQAAAPGTYDKVNTGLTYLATPAGRMNLSPNQVGFASSQPGSSPVRLDGVPGFMRGTPPIRAASVSGENQPSRAAAPGSDKPESDRTQPWLNSQALAYEQDPLVVTRKLTADESVSFTGTIGTFAGGTDRVAGVYGDVTGGTARNGSFTAVSTPAEQFFAGTAGALAATDPASKLVYTRGPVSTVASGSGSFVDNGTTVIVNWGVYGDGVAVNGHLVQDQYTAAPGRKPNYMQLMGALETPAAVLSSLSGTYKGPIAFTPIIAERGVPGGSVTSASIELSNSMLTSYQVGVTDGLARTWSANCPSCVGGVALATFRDFGIVLDGTVVPSASGPAVKATGQANGHPVGPNGEGLISSFALKDGGAAAITGSFAVNRVAF